MYKYRWYCRWCGNTYTPTKQTERDGFCTNKCKQAQHRAYTKYKNSVTPKKGSSRSAATITGKSNAKRKDSK